MDTKLGRGFRFKWVSRFKRLFVSLFIAALTSQAGFADPSNITASNPTTQVVEQNNISVVNIATPSAGGVSHNQFSDFNVNASGVVINNSLQAGDSVLLQEQLNANANLNAGAARLILNEVVSTRRSTLEGTTELFGEKAGYILANPNGVTCNGCGFIRTPTAGDIDHRLSEVMLTTGEPGVDASGLRIDVSSTSNADIVIGPGGLNAAQVDATTLLARQVSIEGLIEAANNELRVIAGGGSLTKVDAAAPGARTWTPAQSATNPITVAIDAANAGAMNAGQIYIQATEQGVGVTLAGELLSTSGDIEITADGNIQYRNANSAGNLTVATVQTGAEITATGDSTAGGDITWNLTGDGTLDDPDSGSVRFQAGGDVQFNCGDATACQVTGDDNITVSAQLLATTAKLQTSTGRDLTINAAVNAQADIDSGGALTITAASGDITARQLTAAEDLVLRTETADAQLTAAALTSTTGDVTWLLKDRARLVLDAPGAVTADSGDVRLDCLPPQPCSVDTDTLAISARRLIGQADVASRGDLSVVATTGSITAGSLNAANNIQLTTVAAGATLATDGISAGGDVTWLLNGDSQLVVTPGGEIRAGQNLRLQCQDATSCGIQSSQNLILAAQFLENTAAITTALGRDLTIEAAAGGHIRVDAAVRSGGDLYLLGAGTYEHADRAGDSIAGEWVIDIFKLVNSGRLSDLKDGTLRVNRLINSGVIQNEGLLQLNVDDLLDNSGVIHSLEGIVRINHSQADQLVGEIRNSGEIAALSLTQNQSPEQSLLVDTSFYVSRHQNAILAGAQRSAQDLSRDILEGNQAAISELTADTSLLGALELSTALLQNTGRIGGGEVSLRGGTLNNTGGVISAASNLRIEAAILNNTNVPAHLGIITARNNLDIVLTGSLTNRGQLESRDIFIQAPVQQNLNSALSAAPTVATVLPTQSLIEDTGTQGQFAVTDDGGPYYRYRRASGAAQGINSDPARLTQAFLSDANASLEPDTVIVGDDVYLSTLIGRTVSAQGGLPFVTDDRHDISQLRTLYRNTLDFMARTGLRFGELPSASAQAELTAPILAFSAQVLADGRSVYAPSVFLPAGGGSIASQLDAFITQIFAQNDLYLSGDQITNTASLKAGGYLTIEAVDVTQDSDTRNWYVDAQGQVQYRGPEIVAGRSVAIRLTGDYVQNGGQVIAQDRVAIEATNILVRGASGGLNTPPPARIFAGDDLFLLAETRAEYGRQVEIESQGDALISAGAGLGFDGQLVTQGDAQLLANDLRVGSGDGFNRGTVLRAGGDLLLQSEQNIQLTAADIRAGGQLGMLAAEGDIVNIAGSIHGEESVFMQAGGDIVNRSVLRVREESTHTDGRGARGWWWRRDRRTVDTRRQYVDVAAAEIHAGAGGITQITGGNIKNLGGTVKSGGDLYQRAEGDIVNRSLAQTYLKEQRIERWSTGSGRRNRDDDYGQNRSSGVREYARYGVTQQIASLEAAGNVIQQSGGTIQNIGGRIEADQSLLQHAQDGIENRSLLTHTTDTARTKTVRAGDRYFRDDDRGSRYQRGGLAQNKSSRTRDYLLTGTLTAGENYIAQVGDEKTAGGDFVNEGNITAGGDVVLQARDIQNRRLQQRQKPSATHYRDVALDTGRMTAGGDLILNAERDILDVAGRYRADGDIMLSAGRDIEQQALILREHQTLQKTYIRLRGREDGRRTKHTFNIGHQSNTRSASGSFNSGGAVALQAGNDISLDGSDITAKDRIALIGHDIRLGAVETGSERVIHRGADEINRTKRHDVAKLNTEGGVFIQAERDLATYGSQLRAGTGADDHMMLNAGGDMRLLGVNNEDYFYYYHKKKKSWGRSKTTIIEDRKVTLEETTIDAGGSLLVNIDPDEYGDIAGRDSGKVVLEGTRIDVGQDALVYGGDSVNVLSGIEYESHRYEKHKRGFGGFSRSGRVHSSEARRLGHAEINTGGNSVLLSGGDINVVAGRISAANIVAEAGFGVEEDAEREASIRIIGDKEALATFDHKYKTSFSLKLEDNFLSFAEEKHNKHWLVDENYIGSMLQAQGDIRLKAKDMVHIVGSELSAGHDLQLAANDINIDPAQDYNLDKEEERVKRIGIEITSDGNGINAFAGIEQKTVTDEYTLDAVHGSLLQAGNRIELQAQSDIRQVSSDLLAFGDITLRAGGEIILDAEHTIESNSHTENVRRTGVSVGLQHNYANTRDAVKNAGEGDNAVSQGSSILRAVDAVDSFLSGPTASGFAGTTTTTESSTETTALARGSRIEGGGDVSLEAGADISLTGAQVLAQYDIALRGTDVDIKAAENRYLQNTEYHTERYGIIASGQKNSASIGVGGSFADQDSDYESSWAQASLLSAGRTAEIQADRDIRVTSSDLEAFDDLIMLAGRDVYLGAQGFGNDYKEDGRSGGGEVGIAMTVGQDGAAVGVYGSANYARSDLDREGLTYRNSHLNAGNRMTLKSGRDTVVRGATAEADHLELDVGRDLTIASIQDTGRADGRQYDASVRVTVGYGWSMSGSLGYGETDGKKAWVEEQTRLIGRESVQARVENHTQLDGAVIAADNGNLTLDTGTLAFSDIRDKDRETSFYANISLSYSGEQGDNPQQQQNNTQTGQSTRSGQQADGGGGLGGTLSGYYNNYDRRQINRATIGEGTILVRADQETGQDSTAGLNRDIRLAQEITRDRRDNIDVYVSDSSIRSISDPVATYQRWKENALNYHVSTMEAIQSLHRSGQIALVFAGALIEHIPNGDLTKAFTSTYTAAFQKTAAWQFVKYNSQALATILDGEHATPEELKAAEAELYGVIGKMLGVEDEVELKIVLADIEGVSFRAVVADGTLYMNHGPRGTSVSDSGDIYSSLFHEGEHLAGEHDEDKVAGGDKLAYQMWYQELRHGGYSDSRNNEADANWIATNRDDTVLRQNTEAFNRLDPSQMEFRQLHLVEGKLIRRTATAFAAQHGISPEESLHRLEAQAKRQTDTDYDDGRFDPAAATWLRDMAVAYLKGRDDKYDVELFHATDKQKDDHSQFAQYNEQNNALFNRPLSDGNPWTTTFINSPGADGYDQSELNHLRLGAVARVELRGAAFGGSGRYGQNELIYGFRDYNSNLRPIPEANAYYMANNIVLNPNDIAQYGSGNLERGWDLEPQAAVQAFGLMPSFMRYDSDSWLSSWGLVAEGHRDFFQEAVRYATGDSPTPLLVIDNGRNTSAQLTDIVNRQLGGYYTALSPAERAPTMAALSALPQGGLLNLSPELEYTTARTMLNNENFVSGANQYLGTITGNTSFFETPYTHITHGVGIVAEQTGRNWELTFTDDNAPQYMQDNAAFGVALDVVGLLPVLKAVSLGRTVGRAGVTAQAARTESIVAARANAVNVSTAGKTAEEAAAIREYARRTNEWLSQNGTHTIQSTAGQLRRESSAAARAERLRAARAGQPYQGQAGHVPDTAVTGQTNPPGGWLDMPGCANNACGGVLGSRVGQRVDYFTVDGIKP